MQGGRIVAGEGRAPAPPRLFVGVRRRVDDIVLADRVQIPGFDPLGDGAELSPGSAGGEAAVRPRRRRTLARNRLAERRRNLGRRGETFEAKRHHVEVARASDPAPDDRERGDRHTRRLADRRQKEPRQRARLLQPLANAMDPLRRRLAAARKQPGGGADRGGKQGSAIERPRVRRHRR